MVFIARFALRRTLRWRKPLSLPHFRRAKPRRPGLGTAAPLLVTIAITAALFAGIVFWMETHIRPLILQMAEARVYYLAYEAINGSIEQRLASDQVQYESLIHFEKDVEGRITALKTDMLAVNRLKASIAEDVLISLRHLEPSELCIPLGNIIGGDFFSGRGPAIPVRIVPLGTVSAEFSNKFSAAGINQTRHQIMLEITADMSVLLIGSNCSQTVRVQISIAETVIVGTVPDSYFSFDSGGDAA